MSGDRKRLRRAMHKRLARESRARTQGYGDLRHTVNDHVWQQKWALYEAHREDQQRLRGTTSDDAAVTDAD